MRYVFPRSLRGLLRACISAVEYQQKKTFKNVQISIETESWLLTWMMHWPGFDLNVTQIAKTKGHIKNLC